MKAGIPLWVILPTNDPATAQTVKAKLNEMIANPMLRIFLESNGIRPDRIVIGEPVATPE